MLKENLRREVELFKRGAPLDCDVAGPYLMDYGLHPELVTRGVPMHAYTVYRQTNGTIDGFRMDANAGLFLGYNTAEGNAPIAFCAFDWNATPNIRDKSSIPCKSLLHTYKILDRLPEDTMLVAQLQDNPELAEYNPFIWKEMLLALTVDFANQTGFRRVAFLPSTKSRYIDIAATYEGILRYDTPAKKEGFVFDNSTGLFVRDLERHAA